MQKSGNSELAWTWQGRHYTLPISASDVLWLARAVDAEGAPRDAVAWTLVQRAAWLSAHGRPSSLTKVVRSYAQPVNPAWFPSGKKHQAEVSRLEQKGDYAGAFAEQAKALLRVKKAQKSWDELTPETREVVAALVSGQSNSPIPGAVHYWASRAPDFEGNQAKRPELVLLDNGFGFDKNVFFAEKGGQGFGGVAVLNGSRLVGQSMAYAGFMGNSGVILAGALLAWVAWKRLAK